MNKVIIYLSFLAISAAIPGQPGKALLLPVKSRGECGSPLDKPHRFSRTFLPISSMSLYTLSPGEFSSPGTASISALSNFSDPAKATSNATSAIVVPIEGMIDLGLSPFVERAIANAEETNASYIVFEINTFGGRLDAAVEIRDAILNTKVPTIAFINKRAISAGALISLACDYIFMTTGGTIGAATPVQLTASQETKPTSEKTVSYFRTEMKATAERTKRPQDIAEAMVDSDVEIKDIIEKGKLLTLTTEESVKYKIANAIAETHDDIFKFLKIDNVTISTHEENWGETFVRFITNPAVNSLLMTIGFLGLVLEFKTAGFGFAGIISILSLILFFFGNSAVHLVGWEDLLIIAIGIALLILEAFIIPGFGIAGILGITAMCIGLTMSLINTNIPLTFDYVAHAFNQVGASFIMTVILGLLLIRLLPKSPIGKRIVLNESLKNIDLPTVSPTREANNSHIYVDSIGRATTDLRPSGKAQFGGHTISVLAEGEFIEKNNSIKIIEIDGPSIIVGIAEPFTKESKND